jgi:hypothetical protein
MVEATMNNPTILLDCAQIIFNTGDNSIVGEHLNVNSNDLILTKLDLILEKLTKKGCD